MAALPVQNTGKLKGVLLGGKEFGFSQGFSLSRTMLKLNFEKGNEGLMLRTQKGWIECRLLGISHRPYYRFYTAISYTIVSPVP